MKANPEAELRELAGTYVVRGITPALADQVASQMMAKDALGAHARDKLGMSEFTAGRPIQAAGASATSFTVGAVLPLTVDFLAPIAWVLAGVPLAALGSLALLGAIDAHAGGAGVVRAVTHVTSWGAIAMAVTAGIGRIFGAFV